MAKDEVDSPSPPSIWRLVNPKDPRTAVLGGLAAALLFGGGWKVLQGIQARRAVAALNEPDPSVEEVEGAADHGRAGLIELFRLLETAEKPEVREAAGRALATLWAKDELIPEEEKGLVRRGFAVTWRARRRYPRGLNVPIPIEASYGVPFLVEGGRGVNPSNLVWSHRILGAERAGLESPSPWREGAGLASFEVDPSDFPTLGPHRLALAARVRVVGLTDLWEIEFPHLPFSFEFDPILTVEAILTSEDDSRVPDFERAVRLETAKVSEARSPLPDLYDPTLDAGVLPPFQGGLTAGDSQKASRTDLAKTPEALPRYLDLNADLVLRDPPDLVVTPPLPSDLAHALSIEIEGVPGRFLAGQVVLSGQGTGLSGSVEPRRFPIDRVTGIPDDAIDRPGERRIRAVLTANPHLGWADPDVRSLWPGTLTTDWVTVRVVRR